MHAGGPQVDLMGILIELTEILEAENFARNFVFFPCACPTLLVQHSQGTCIVLPMHMYVLVRVSRACGVRDRHSINHST